MRSRLNGTLHFSVALTIGSLGGLLFWTIHSPLPWMLGAMVACAVASLARLPVATPTFARPPVTALVGTVLGASFTADAFAHSRDWLLPLAVLVAFLIVGGASTYAVLRHVGRYDRATAFFGGMPGGLVEMVTLGKEYGGDDRLIALAHAARVFLVVLSLPFVLQMISGQPLPRTSGPYVSPSAMSLEQGLWFIGTYIAGLLLAWVAKLPARYVFVPLALSSFVHLSGLTDFVLPTAVIVAAQVTLGAVVGCRFVGLDRKVIFRSLGLSVLATATLLCATLFFAAFAAHVTDVPIESLILAYSPGGLAEMSLVALALNGEVAFVLFHHFARIAAVIVAAPLLFFLVDRSNRT